MGFDVCVNFCCWLFFRLLTVSFTEAVSSVLFPAKIKSSMSVSEEALGGEK